jgi:hypothetical protein
VLKKSFFTDDRKFSGPLMRLSRCEVREPHQLPQKRSLALASILQSLAAAQIANALHSRDFRSPAIFEFFNTIDKVQPEVNLLAAFSLAIVGAFAVGLPVAVAIIWVCS